MEKQTDYKYKRIHRNEFDTVAGTSSVIKDLFSTINFKLCLLILLVFGFIVYAGFLLEFGYNKSIFK